MNFKDFPVNALMDITSRPDLVFVKGEGMWLWDHSGKVFEVHVMSFLVE